MGALAFFHSRREHFPKVSLLSFRENIIFNGEITRKKT